MSEAAPPWFDAALAAALFAVDPAATAGVVLRAGAGEVRDRWLALVRELLAGDCRMHKLPLNVGDERLLGGLDLAATLKAGRPVAQQGVLARADGGVLVASMAERMSPSCAARICAALDTGEVLIEREGLRQRAAARFGLIALDEGVDDERPPAALADRLAFQLDLTPIRYRDAGDAFHTGQDVAQARKRLGAVTAGDDALESLSEVAQALGISSPRPVLLALQVARIAAALDARDAVSQDDIVLAGRLVLAARATRLPPQEDAPQAEGDSPPPPPAEEPAGDDNVDAAKPLSDIVLAATQAAIPPGLLAQLRVAMGGRTRMRSTGRAGALRLSTLRGRPAGAKRGEPCSGARLNVVETLRAAAPWQRLRREASARATAPGARRIEVRSDDFRVTRYKHREQTTTIFVVDASGSSALHRLAEAKGAVELLLADCYVRRDRVALVVFRGRAAQLLLPPTRSLARAKRSLAGLPGGGGTPLASGIDAALALADTVRRRAETPVVVLMTDGRANVARDGEGSRERAGAEALDAARQARLEGYSALLVDTSPQPQARARELADAMGAGYLPLPHADAAALARAVRNA